MHVPPKKERKLMKITAEHQPSCARVFTSELGEQLQHFGSLECECGQMIPYVRTGSEFAGYFEDQIHLAETGRIMKKLKEFIP